MRQTQVDPLLSPTQGVDGRCTVDAWPRATGTTLNAGVRVGF